MAVRLTSKQQRGQKRVKGGEGGRDGRMALSFTMPLSRFFPLTD